MSILGSQAFGVAAGLATSFFDDRRQREFKEKQERIAQEARERLEPALARRTGDIERISEQNLLASREFFAGAGDRFRGVADPLTADIERRTSLGVSGAQDIAGGFGDLETEGRAQGESLFRGQQRREERLLREFGNLGDVERGELNRRFGALGRTEQARLTGAGLGGTTLASGVASGIERFRGRDLALLNEGLRRERLGFSERLSGETLSTRDLVDQRALELGRGRLGAEASSLEFATGLRGEEIQGKGELGFGRLQAEEQAFRDRINAESLFGTAGAEAGVAEARELNQLELEQIVNEPPRTDQGSQLTFLGSQEGGI